MLVLGVPAAGRLVPAVPRHVGDVSAAVEGSREHGRARERTRCWRAADDHGVAMVIVLWFVQDCAVGKQPLKKRPTCSHA